MSLRWLDPCDSHRLYLRNCLWSSKISVSMFSLRSIRFDWPTQKNVRARLYASSRIRPQTTNALFEEESMRFISIDISANDESQHKVRLTVMLEGNTWPAGAAQFGLLWVANNRS